ncbi:MAG: T9SS type A sorting domain-containing protein, partial [Bacteroidetes bacterium]|nr:T9SS type A sorting domain-containing protein [Bacteroidota bacterium]
QGVKLSWTTASEQNNLGFEVQRSVAGGSFNKIAFVDGHGTTNAPQSYSYVDASAAAKASYRLKQIDRDGKFTYSQTVEVNGTGAASSFGLGQNYPNPFNPATSIQYHIPVSGSVSLKVYDMLGKEVAVLVNGVRPAGENTASFNAATLPSGMYFYTLRAANFTATKKMMLVK